MPSVAQSLRTSWVQVGEGVRNVVVICCGSFNPPTRAHVEMLHAAKNYIQQRGWHYAGGVLSPVHDGYAKATLIDAHHRVEMCRLAAADECGIVVDDWESRQPVYTRTLTVLKHYRALFGTSVDVMLVGGADLVLSFFTPGVWNPTDVRILLEDYGVICIARDGAALRSRSQNSALRFEDVLESIHFISDFEFGGVGSTEVRRRVHSNLEVTDLIHSAVQEYIRKERLYREIPETELP